MKESDWKLFNKIREKALPEYCTKSMSLVKESIENEKKSVQERFCDMYTQVLELNKRRRIIFNHPSKEDAFTQLTMMRKEGIADSTLVSQLSDEFQHSTDPNQL